MRRMIAVAILFALVGCTTDTAKHAVEPKELEFVSNERGLDSRNMDLSVAPCDDFYQYANGKWLERNPTPADRGSWGTMDEMRDRNELVLRDILEAAAAADAKKGTNKQKAGDFWAVGMDTEKIEEQGFEPIAADLERIARIESNADLQSMIRDQHYEGSSPLFGLAIDQDLKDSEKYIAYAVQAGLGLPDRDYYTRDDEESIKLREQYVEHVSAMLQLLGDSAEDAGAAAISILELETRLANASLTSVELRDPSNYYNIQEITKADELTPHFSWSSFFEQLGVGEMGTFSYAHPKFFAEMEKALEEIPLATWKNYLRWNVVNESAPYLAERFVEQDFDFFSRTLRGSEEIRPRWKRVIDQTSASLGEALGEVYVEKAFPPATKARADKMIQDLAGAIGTRVSNLDWMGEETKEQALEKLSTFTPKIGYPDEWRDYSTLEIGQESYLANVRAANRFETQRNLDKIGAPIDRKEWGMAPQTVNASYNPLKNEIVFPAAIMQPPYFDGEADDALNYGGMGAVIGHEFMHGFDDQGSRFDAQGNMESWWTEEDSGRFEERTQKLVEQYAGYVAVDDLHVNGELTLGENIGDLAGLTMAYYALQSALEGQERTEIDGFTPEQRFFLSWAQGWRKTYRDETLKLQVNTDPHSPANFRVLGPMANMPEFAAAFGCEEGSAMVLPEDKRADIW